MNRRRRRGLSVAEVAVCTLLVGAVLVGALHCLGATVRARAAVADQSLATHLAHELMVEILSKPYRDPGPLPVFGLESGETAGVRSGYNDVDDYHGHVESPPQSPDGAARSHLPDWQRTVTVSWVAAGDPSAASAVDEGMKRITVTLIKSGAVQARHVALRSNTQASP